MKFLIFFFTFREHFLKKSRFTFITPAKGSSLNMFKSGGSPDIKETIILGFNNCNQFLRVIRWVQFNCHVKTSWILWIFFSLKLSYLQMTREFGYTGYFIRMETSLSLKVCYCLYGCSILDQVHPEGYREEFTSLSPNHTVHWLVFPKNIWAFFGNPFRGKLCSGWRSSPDVTEVRLVV